MANWASAESFANLSTLRIAKVHLTQSECGRPQPVTGVHETVRCGGEKRIKMCACQDTHNAQMKIFQSLLCTSCLLRWFSLLILGGASRYDVCTEGKGDKKCSNIADKQCTFCGQRGGGVMKNPKIKWISLLEVPLLLSLQGYAGQLSVRNGWAIAVRCPV